VIYIACTKRGTLCRAIQKDILPKTQILGDAIGWQPANDCSLARCDDRNGWLDMYLVYDKNSAVNC